MKTRLDQLTLHNLIELSCGDSSVLLDKDEAPTENVKLACAQQIMSEYKELATPTQAKMDMIEAEEQQKLRMKEKCLHICLALISQERSDMAKDVLLELDVNENLLKSEEAIKSRCNAMLDEVKYEIKRLAELAEERGQKKQQTVTEIRKAWFGEIAFVMSTLKMSIDPATTNAAVYANLVRQAVERNKQLAKMPPMMSMFM
jgi:hypothetical protein